MGVDPHARTSGQVEPRKRAAAGAGPALRVQRLGVDAPLHGKAPLWHRRRWVQAQVSQAVPGSNANLQLH